MLPVKLFSVDSLSASHVTRATSDLGQMAKEPVISVFRQNIQVLEPESLEEPVDFLPEFQGFTLTGQVESL